MPLGDDQRLAASKQVLSRVLGGDAVLLDLQSGRYFALDEVGSCIWQGIEAGSTVAEIAARVLAEFEVDAATARRDLDDLVAELLARGLAVVSG